MQSDDAFRRAYEQATADLAVMAEALSSVAAVTVESAASFWRLALRPKATAACPIELVLDPEKQSFDVQIGADTWEGSPIDDLATLRHLVAAVVAGRVISRSTMSPSTGSTFAVETLLDLGGGVTWTRRRTLPLGKNHAAETSTTIDRHWAAYRRA